MGYPTDSTIWPTCLSSDARQLIDHFFTLADTRSDDAGPRLAQEIFTPNGEFISPQATFVGSAEISESRKNAWTVIKSRQHTVSKVYVNDARGTDLIIIGRLRTESVDGKEASMDFVARMLLNTGDQGPRVSLYRVISPPAQDPRPIV
ncbi:hypothetical protein BJX66DRAFT_343838 [Aspergillus keveii]|uniref:SnoaL-like domain-containing protein n=1 Tax=Aspergillus keveii TaxID=714993 RepID=A0ABR4FNN3_9EURO